MTRAAASAHELTISRLSTMPKPRVGLIFPEPAVAVADYRTLINAELLDSWSFLDFAR